MAEPNPYESPPTFAERVAGPAKARRRPVGLSALLITVGAGFLLLLNGKPFTNTLAFLGFCVASALLWVPLLPPSPRNYHRRQAFCVVVVHTIIIVLFTATLREAYERQRQFDAARQKAREAVRERTSQPTYGRAPRDNLQQRE